MAEYYDEHAVRDRLSGYWCPVAAKLPDKSTTYVLVAGTGSRGHYRCAGIYFGGGEFRDGFSNILDGVMHWMPMPRHPSEE